MVVVVERAINQEHPLFFPLIPQPIMASSTNLQVYPLRHNLGLLPAGHPSINSISKQPSLRFVAFHNPTYPVDIASGLSCFSAFLKVKEEPSTVVGACLILISSTIDGRKKLNFSYSVFLPDMVAHTSSLSYSGSKDRKIKSLRPT
jgi:hypothetical protein